jgi:two-component system, chemotaxis family, protein-glutamate methylesterase/glutaminase
MEMLDVLKNGEQKQEMKNSIIENRTTNLHRKYSKMEPSDIYLSVNWNQMKKKMILIGTSTGGPSALQNVLTKLPSNIQAPIIISQHMPAGFTKSLANRLNSLSEINVKEAENREVIINGTAYIAPGGFHLKLKQIGENIMIQLEKSIQKYLHCPSVDVMFESAAQIKDYGKIVVVMTGMGSDGTKGLISLKSSGHVRAIAESEETSIVFGMPKAAIATNLIDEIKDLENIAETIIKYV